MVHEGVNKLRVRVVPMYEYLGVWMDKSLSWEYHIANKVLPNAMRLIGQISRIATLDVINSAASLQFIQTNIMSAVTYACDVWGWALWCPQNRSEEKAIADSRTRAHVHAYAQGSH
jgi:hypothetical protein